jgi:asparaginyl-tRNA synthetase
MAHIEEIVCRIRLCIMIVWFIVIIQICQTVDKLLNNPSSADLIKHLNPNFQAPARPFLRLSYVEAIKWLNERGIKHSAEDEQGNPIKDENGEDIMVDHTVGDDIAEAAERQMTDIIGTPIFLYGFPAKLKAFYMKKAPKKEGDEDVVFTESCDLLMPNVGEIVGEHLIPEVWSFVVAHLLYRRVDEDCRYGRTVCCVQKGRHRSRAILLVYRST